MRKLLVCSDLALYSPFKKVVYLLSKKYNIESHVIYPKEHIISPVYLTSKFDGEHELDKYISFYALSANSSTAIQHGFNPHELKHLLEKISPDYIWLHVEITEGLPLQFLWHYRFNRHPRIIAYFAANHLQGPRPVISSKWPFVSRGRIKQLLLWPRLNGVAACATKALECARRIGLPEQVPVVVNYLPTFGPEESAAQGIDLPWSQNETFIIGFAGRLTEQKGWKVLLKAVESLHERFKVVLAGTGPQRQELEEWLQRPKLQGRAYYAGLLSKEKLLATYPLFDVFVLPSITTPEIVEQFGAVLAEAMACGVPVIGSDSGAIPEAVDQGGLIFPEGDSAALAQVILRMSENETLRQTCAAKGMKRHKDYYSCEVYAESIAHLLKIV
jgi:glycosyltransferase involved in cell wall biosynthesis